MPKPKRDDDGGWPAVLARLEQHSSRSSAAHAELFDARRLLPGAPQQHQQQQQLSFRTAGEYSRYLQAAAVDAALARVRAAAASSSVERLHVTHELTARFGAGSSLLTFHPAPPTPARRLRDAVSAQGGRGGLFVLSWRQQPGGEELRLLLRTLTCSPSGDLLACRAFFPCQGGSPADAICREGMRGRRCVLTRAGDADALDAALAAVESIAEDDEGGCALLHCLMQPPASLLADAVGVRDSDAFATIAARIGRALSAGGGGGVRLVAADASEPEASLFVQVHASTQAAVLTARAHAAAWRAERAAAAWLLLRGGKLDRILTPRGAPGLPGLADKRRQLLVCPSEAWLLGVLAALEQGAVQLGASVVAVSRSLVSSGRLTGLSNLELWSRAGGTILQAAGCADADELRRAHARELQPLLEDARRLLGELEAAAPGSAQQPDGAAEVAMAALLQCEERIGAARAAHQQQLQARAALRALSKGSAGFDFPAALGERRAELAAHVAAPKASSPAQQADLAAMLRAHAACDVLRARGQGAAVAGLLAAVLRAADVACVTVADAGCWELAAVAGGAAGAFDTVTVGGAHAAREAELIAAVVRARCLVLVGATGGGAAGAGAADSMFYRLVRGALAAGEGSSSSAAGRQRRRPGSAAALVHVAGGAPAAAEPET